MVGSASRLPDERGDLTLQTVRVGHRTVLAAAGEMDLITAPQVEQAAASALDEGAQELWVDLSAVEFIDSTGIHVLLGVRSRVAELGRAFAVICPFGPIRRAFALTGLEDALPLFASRDEAHHQRG